MSYAQLENITQIFASVYDYAMWMHCFFCEKLQDILNG